jgi:hypothetical protein
LHYLGKKVFQRPAELGADIVTDLRLAVGDLRSVIFQRIHLMEFRRDTVETIILQFYHPDKALPAASPLTILLLPPPKTMTVSPATSLGSVRVALPRGRPSEAISMA